MCVFDTLHVFSLESKSSCDLFEGEVKSESVRVTETQLLLLHC